MPDDRFEGAFDDFFGGAAEAAGEGGFDELFAMGREGDLHGRQDSTPECRPITRIIGRNL